MGVIRHEPVIAKDARAARTRTAGSGIVRTPLLRLSVEDAPADIHLKLENLQPIGSFKIRGLSNAMMLAERSHLRAGVWTVSAGNAAQGLAWSARRMGIPCAVVVPEGASRAKVAALRRMGVRIVTVAFDTWLDVARTRMFEGQEGLFVHPFSDPAVMAGNGVIALEILEDLPDVEAVLVPWGGGGLCCGIAGVMRDLAPHVRVYACEFFPTSPLQASLRADEPTEVPYEPSFVDGIGAPIVFSEMFELARGLVDASLAVPLDDVAAALRSIAERNHVIVEGAGAVATAVALSGAAGTGRVACIVSGGNIDLATFTSLVGDGSSELGSEGA